MSATDRRPAVPRIIGIDWGSSRLRGRAVAENGDVLGSFENDTGVLVTAQGELADKLAGALVDWQERWPDCPVLASGMIGSRNGLTEVPYVDTPAGASEVRRGIRQAQVGTNLKLNIIPGVRQRNERGIDIMRGEETALIGWLSRNCVHQHQRFVLPGTHSKWVRLADEKIADFCTFPTGELYDVLRHSPSLQGLDPDTASDVAAFRNGLDIGLAARGLFHDYFSIRARIVSESVGAKNIQDQLSGILIGYEIAEARNRSLLRSNDEVTVIGQGPLARRYVDALLHAHVSATLADGDYLTDGWLTLCENLSSRRENSGYE